MAAEKLCPRCGAYWACDCPVEVPSYIPDASCQHDWIEAVGVEVHDGIETEEQRQVFVCRLCGVYAVSDPVDGTWGT